jgi:hypothetical protein
MFQLQQADSFVHIFIYSASTALQAIQGFCDNVGIAASRCEQTIKPQLLSTIKEKLDSGKVRLSFSYQAVVLPLTG